MKVSRVLTYGGYWTILTSTTDSPVGTTNTVWTMEVTGGSVEIEVLGPSGTYQLTTALDPDTGTFNETKSYTSPDKLTATVTGTIAPDGTVTGSSSIDYGSDGTVDQTDTLTAQKNSTGYIVRGTITDPNGTEGGDHTGKPYLVMIDSDGDGGNGGQVGSFQGVAGGSPNMCYIVMDVPAGEWDAYGILYMYPAADFEPHAPVPGDYIGDESSIPVADNEGVFDFDLYERPTPEGSLDLLGTWETESWYWGGGGTGSGNVTTLAFDDSVSPWSITHVYYHSDGEDGPYTAVYEISVWDPYQDNMIWYVASQGASIQDEFLNKYFIIGWEDLEGTGDGDTVAIRGYGSPGPDGEWGDPNGDAQAQAQADDNDYPVYDTLEDALTALGRYGYTSPEWYEAEWTHR